MSQAIRVLLVDDDAEMRARFRSELEAEGIEVAAEAANGRDAIIAATQHASDVIILDIDMPILDGLQALPVLKAQQPDVPIVMLTDLPPERALADSLSGDVAGFLTKASAVGRLAEKVRSAAAGESVYTQEVFDTLASAFVKQAKKMNEYEYFREAIEGLPATHHAVANLLIHGESNPNIALALGLSENTVRDYVSHILRVTECSTRGAVSMMALRAGLIE